MSSEICSRCNIARIVRMGEGKYWCPFCKSLTLIPLTEKEVCKQPAHPSQESGTDTRLKGEREEIRRYIDTPNIKGKTREDRSKKKAQESQISARSKAEAQTGRGLIGILNDKDGLKFVQPKVSKKIFLLFLVFDLTTVMILYLLGLYSHWQQIVLTIVILHLLLWPVFKAFYYKHHPSKAHGIVVANIFLSLCIIGVGLFVLFVVHTSIGGRGQLTEVVHYVWKYSGRTGTEYHYSNDGNNIVGFIGLIIGIIIIGIGIAIWYGAGESLRGKHDEGQPSISEVQENQIELNESAMLTQHNTSPAEGSDKQAHRTDRRFLVKPLKPASRIQRSSAERDPKQIAPCPYCGQPLRTPGAKQCRHCLMDWHDPENTIKIGSAK